jgi:hypothetical protein
MERRACPWRAKELLVKKKMLIANVAAAAPRKAREKKGADCAL